MTVNVLCGLSLRTSRCTESDIIADPLVILRCDERIFRSGPLLAVILRILNCFLIASRTQLNAQLMANAPTDNPAMQALAANNIAELRSALIATQESTAIQLLLEICVPRDDSERVSAFWTTGLQ